MKILHIVFFLFVFSSSFLWADVRGDVNGDERIGLEEAVHALQVTAGVKSDNELSRTKAYVEKTGQTTCYDPNGTSGIVDCTETQQQDGFLKNGVSVSDRFTDTLDGSVTDNLTGLIWKKTIYMDNKFFWVTAFSYNRLSGDWRIPNIKELQSLVDFGNSSPALPAGHPFIFDNPISTMSNTVWSCTTDAGNPDKSFIINLDTGCAESIDKVGTGGLIIPPEDFEKYHSVWPVKSIRD